MTWHVVTLTRAGTLHHPVGDRLVPVVSQETGEPLVLPSGTPCLAEQWPDGTWHIDFNGLACPVPSDAIRVVDEAQDADAGAQSAVVGS